MGLLPDVRKENSMKRLVIFIFLLAPVVAFCADRYLVRLVFGDPDYPEGWPSEQATANDELIKPGWTTNWSRTELEAVRSSLQSQFDAIQAAKLSAIIADRNSRIQLLQDLFNDFDTYEIGWRAGTNYTAAQMQVILRKHNGALLLLKPMLKELYDSRQ